MTEEFTPEQFNRFSRLISTFDSMGEDEMVYLVFYAADDEFERFLKSKHL